MAKRPVFIPSSRGFPFVREVTIEFKWYPGFSKSQAQKSIDSLHKAAANHGISPILEVSSKSENPLGVSLSAFNLLLTTKRQQQMTVECAFQGSKVFERGGPHIDLYSVSSREAKTDTRLRNSGDLVGFKFMEEDFPTYPKTAFYDWLYITALWQNSELAKSLSLFCGFSDIAFNPKRSINCQARSAALFVSLSRRGLIEEVIKDMDCYLNLITETESQDQSKGQVVQQLDFLS